MSDVEPGGRFVARRPFKIGRDAPRKLAARNISESELGALLDDHVVLDVIEPRHRYVLFGRVEGRPLIAVIADDELDDATVLISVYEPDEEHGWTTEKIERMLNREPEEGTP